MRTFEAERIRERELAQGADSSGAKGFTDNDILRIEPTTQGRSVEGEATLFEQTTSLTAKVRTMSERIDRIDSRLERVEQSQASLLQDWERHMKDRHDHHWLCCLDSHFIFIILYRF